MGMWVPVHGDVWDGDIPLETGAPITDSQSGEVAFRGGALPWKTGTYEVRRILAKLFEPDPTRTRSAITTMGSTTLWPPQGR